MWNIIPAMVSGYSKQLLVWKTKGIPRVVQGSVPVSLCTRTVNDHLRWHPTPSDVYMRHLNVLHYSSIFSDWEAFRVYTSRPYDVTSLALITHIVNILPGGSMGDQCSLCTKLWYPPMFTFGHSWKSQLSRSCSDLLYLYHPHLYLSDPFILI